MRYMTALRGLWLRFLKTPECLLFVTKILVAHLACLVEIVPVVEKVGVSVPAKPMLYRHCLRSSYLLTNPGAQLDRQQALNYGFQ